MKTEQTATPVPPQTISIDKLNALVDALPTGQQYRRAAMELCLLEPFHFLAHITHDRNINPVLQGWVEQHLLQAFTFNHMSLFAGEVLEKAKAASTAYEMDYLYTLYLAMTDLIEQPEYINYQKASAALHKDNPKIVTQIEAVGEEIKKHEQEVWEQVMRDDDNNNLSSRR